ncbi:MAG: hypothetical protein JJE02_08990 [Propionibacteriales bacterium]|nr:hypothetical protein [Propionibacteriales bacterium]
MSRRSRVVALVSIVAALILGAGIYVGIDFSLAEGRSSAPPTAAIASVSTIETQPRVVFRNTGVGSKYGLVSMVSLSDPGGTRAFTRAVCDRVYATAGKASCLKIKRGIATTFEAEQLDAKWKTEKTWALPGIPSRTRLSADGKLMATTSFVFGHSYEQTGSSTATEIRQVGGRDYGNLEKFALFIDGKKVDSVEHNIWGVTFGADGNLFYATAATGGTTYLVRGNLRSRTLTAVHVTAECPSLSPDGSKVAYKKNTGGSSTHWAIAVLDLASDQETVLKGEIRNVDDQVEWLDGSTVLYGLSRTDEAGVSDIWAIKTNQGARPVVFIKRAWSPSVVRN